MAEPTAAAAAKAEKPVTIYDAFRDPTDRRLRRLPRLVRSAFALVRKAAPRQLNLLLFLQVVGGMGNAAQLLVGSKVVAEVLRADRLGLGLTSVLPELLALVTVGAIVQFAGAARQELSMLLGEAAIRHTQTRIIDVAMAVDLEAFERPGFHDRLQRAQMAAGGRPLNLVMAAAGLVGSVVGVLGLTLALAALAPPLIPLIIVGHLPVWLASVKNSQASYRWGWRHTPADRLRHYLQMLLSSKHFAQELRAFGLGTYARQRYDKLYDERIAQFTDLTRRRVRRSLWASLANSILTAASYALLVWLLLTDRVSAAAAVPAAVGIQQLSARLGAIASNLGQIYESSLFLDDFDSFLELAPAVAASRPDGPAPPAFDVLTMEGVSFVYPDADRLALDGVSMQIRAGEIVALVGENGSGKTTLAKLLCALYQPTSGRILWDDLDVASCDPAELRRRVAVIFQDFTRYQLSARENVGVGDCSRVDDLDGILAACRESGADGFLAGLADGYETQLGREFEGGTELSIGQWQRVALARAFFRDAPFVILDEPTAALDARAEHELFERIRAVAKGRTVLLISHRFSSVRSADRIFVLEAGRVVEQGTHADLLAEGGRYAELFNLQAEAYLKEPAARSL